MLNPAVEVGEFKPIPGGFRLHGWLLAIWFAASFGVVFFARDLQIIVAGWPLGYWFAAQGSVFIFIAVVAVFAWVANRRDREITTADAAYTAYKHRLHWRFSAYVVCLLLFLLALALAERLGLKKMWVGSIFLFATVALYAVIGIYGRTSDASEYYVAGRSIPAVYNGMAVAADWMSAASFISMAGGLYLQGFSGTPSQPGGLVYVLGWTGGFCLVGLLVAPYLRKLDLYTVPDYFGVRFGGRWPRMIAAFAAVLCSFTYVVAQIYGVGLITSRLTGVQFEIGILLGLGGVLVCSFLGGMRAVTWTQVTQYVVLILAFLIPVSWLAYKQLGNPLAPFVYGQQLQKITELERQLIDSPAELQVINEYARRARDYERKLQHVEASLESERNTIREKIRFLNEHRVDESIVVAARRELAALPKDTVSARERWMHAMQDNLDRAQPLGGMPAHAKPFAGDPQGSADEKKAFDVSRRNFLALTFCLMVGTAGLPHLLTRFYTTRTVAEARTSVVWSLFFIALLYLSAPALAVLVKFEVMSQLVGQNFDSLPVWIAQWAKVDPTLVSVSDVNGDHILQFSELKLGADIVMLATPELGGLPYVVSGLVAAGGLAAALSTADGLLLTIGNALAHDLFYRGGSSQSEAVRRVMLSKFALLLVALVAAYVAAQRPADILYLVSASFSLAGAAFVPVMVLGIFWRRTTRLAAVVGMITGLGLTIYYMAVNSVALRSVLGLSGTGLWLDIQPVSAGVFGVLAGFVVTVLVSLLSRSESSSPG
ncbi:Na+/solute symporter [Rhodoferax ferrireducens T118]|uniref:Na+/solute symporter n=1 Tax=Albidiferax ferrireducens (strain ATCC BAA-621 / DSM 15236 / T118) TaxID=338969 RepID=Q21WD7_ALBFT|nr:VC_2705 family sodium/solute symporter [Rhodoferax ferrireducens]ABD69916.1 Na+/solute symporter [Rhodoferax ferrireducens T118]